MKTSVYIQQYDFYNVQEWDDSDKIIKIMQKYF